VKNIIENPLYSVFVGGISGAIYKFCALWVFNLVPTSIKWLVLVLVFCSMLWKSPKYFGDDPIPGFTGITIGGFSYRAKAVETAK